MFFRGEKEKLKEVLKIADQFGYGNLIALLKRGWTNKLMKDGIDENSALEAANTSAYAKDLFDEIQKED